MQPRLDLKSLTLQRLVQIVSLEFSGLELDSNEISFRVLDHTEATSPQESSDDYIPSEPLDETIAIMIETV